MLKNYIATTIAATGLIIFIFGIDCSAQSTRRLTVDIPFDFYVGEEKLTRGKYEFESVKSISNSGSVVVRPVVKSGRHSLIVATMAETAKPGDTAILQFNRYDSEYFLSKVNLNADEVSFRVRRTSSEDRLAKLEQGVPVTIGRTAVAGR